MSYCTHIHFVHVVQQLFIHTVGVLSHIFMAIEYLLIKHRPQSSSELLAICKVKWHYIISMVNGITYTHTTFDYVYDPSKTEFL